MTTTTLWTNVILPKVIQRRTVPIAESTNDWVYFSH